MSVDSEGGWCLVVDGMVWREEVVWVCGLIVSRSVFAAWRVEGLGSASWVVCGMFGRWTSKLAKYGSGGWTRRVCS